MSPTMQKSVQYPSTFRRAFGARSLAALLVIAAGVVTGVGLTRQNGAPKPADAKPGDGKPAARSDSTKPSTSLEDVYSFGEKAGHPEWSILRPVKDASGKVANDPATGQPLLPRDTTPLRFGHGKHMTSPSVRTKLAELRDGKSQSPTDTGRKIHIEFGKDESGKDTFEMACTFCHESDAAGRYMKPIKFEVHCADCHMEQIGIVSAAAGKEKGADGKPIGTLKVSKAVLNDEARADSYNPSQLPHGNSRAVADIVDKQIGLWALASPPVVDKAKAEEMKKAAPAEEEAPKPKSRRGSADKAEEKPAEKAEEKPEEKQPPSGGRRRSSEAAAPAAEAAGPKGPPAIGRIFEDLKAVEAWRVDTRDKAMNDIRANCTYCHQPNAISDGPGADKALFVVSEQKIPEIWLTKSVFAHSSHAMVSCVECHTLAKPPAPKDGDEKSKTFFDWANKTERIMLPGIDSCRDCHASVTKTGASGAPHECVLCHTYHVKLPVSAQGKMTIEGLLNGAKPTSAAAPAKSGTKPETKPESKPAAKTAETPATGEAGKK